MILESTTDEECYQMARQFIRSVLDEDPDKQLPVAKMGQFWEYLSDTGMINRMYPRRRGND